MAGGAAGQEPGRGRGSGDPKGDDLDLHFAIRTRMIGPDHAAEQRVEESEQRARAMLRLGWSGRRVREMYSSASANALGPMARTFQELFPRRLRFMVGIAFVLPEASDRSDRGAFGSRPNAKAIGREAPDVRYLGHVDEATLGEYRFAVVLDRQSALVDRRFLR